jgi:hypothetical protein
MNTINAYVKPDRNYALYVGGNYVGCAVRSTEGFIFSGQDGQALDPMSMKSLKAALPALYPNPAKPAELHFTVDEARLFTAASHTAIRLSLDALRLFHPYLNRSEYGDVIVYQWARTWMTWEERHPDMAKMGRDFLKRNPHLGRGLREVDFDHYELTEEVRYLD